MLDCAMNFQRLFSIVLVAIGMLLLPATPPAHALHPKLNGLLRQISRHFGRPVTITSGCRSRRENMRAGGRRGSYHLRCMAADIRVAGVAESNVRSFARSLSGRGGIGSYCRNSVVHIDVGPRREWFQNCGGRKKQRHQRKRR
jgi:uncharacterized protein YcbK (DUF882 family)